MQQLIMNDKEILIQKIKEYINIIQKEFKDYVKIPNNIDYDKIVHIAETGTISLFIRNGEFYFPIDAYRTLDSLKKHHKFGTDKKHKTYNRETLIVNDNNFLFPVVNKSIFSSGTFK